MKIQKLMMYIQINLIENKEKEIAKNKRKS